MEYVFGILQALVIVGVVWVRINGVEKRLDHLEKRVDNWLNGKGK